LIPGRAASRRASGPAPAPRSHDHEDLTVPTDCQVFVIMKTPPAEHGAAGVQGIKPHSAAPARREVTLLWNAYPVARIFRGSPIFRDLPGSRRTTARWRTTAHTGITAGPRPPRRSGRRARYRGGRGRDRRRGGSAAGAAAPARRRRCRTANEAARASEPGWLNGAARVTCARRERRPRRPPAGRAGR
jgi:hypothetical protein